MGVTGRGGRTAGSWNQGLRIIGGGVRLEPAWPELSSYPGYGLVRTRLDFDEILARTAQKAGARLLEGVTVTGPVLDDTGRITGVTARPTGRRRRPELGYRARVSWRRTGITRLSVAMGLSKRDDRPMGVAVRTYYTSPRHDDDYLESWLTCGTGRGSCRATGGSSAWATAPATWGSACSTPPTSFGNVDYGTAAPLAGRDAGGNGATSRRTAPAHPRGRPADGLQTAPALHPGAAPRRGRGGMVNPFNGEGIPYALESGELAAQFIVQALARPDAAGPSGC